ncbi:DNA-binding response regulator [Arthrobacter sp. GN70]|uniref:Response regulator transcription factor n=1 Tax=Arthrobacter terricola TaxID=2547396 RepID=A0A4R5KCD5_9MICC|nr:DNA-binding response regulator [Arthrobacter sp. GN70]TDF92911.1 response regulator transcription factor [Arthrobacter terricola]
MLMNGMEVSLHREGKPFGVTYAGKAPTVDALLNAGRNVCDVVALDLQLADGSRPGDNTARLISAGYKVLAFTVGTNQAHIHEALANGALGVSLKTEPLAETFSKLRRVAAGETIDEIQLATAIELDTEFVEANLSEREKECLALYATGFGQDQVALRMNIASSTVKTNIVRIREKFAAAGRPADTKIKLYIRAVEEGIVPPPQPLNKRLRRSPKGTAQ